jgi:RNA polymerase sigma-70 factor (ECF subfamily)
MLNHQQLPGSNCECGAQLHHLHYHTQEPMPQEFDKHAFFESAISRMMDRLYGAAMRFTRNESDAEDLMSTAIEKAWKGFDRLEDIDRFDGWMMRILSNTCISQWRKNKTHDKVFDSSESADDLDDSQSLYARLHQPFLLWYGTPERNFLNNLLLEDITRALDGLSDGHREIVVMVEVLGLSYDEVARDLEIPVGTVRSRLSRGRKQLQGALWLCASEEGISTN